MLAAKAALANAIPCAQLLQPLWSADRPFLAQALTELIPTETDSAEPLLIDIQGRSGAGKTHLLYLLSADALIAGKSIVVFDAEGTWDVLRLVALLEQHEEPFKARTLLDNLLIYHPQSATELLDDVTNLTQALDRHMREVPVRYILVDSISSFFWQAKTLLPNIIDALRKAASSLHTNVVITNWHIGWQHFSPARSLHLTVERKEVLPFTQGMEQALNTADARKEVLGRGLFYLRNARGDRKTFCIRTSEVSLE